VLICVWDPGNTRPSKAAASLIACACEGCSVQRPPCRQPAHAQH
jgi:hypothetical protein